MPTYPSYRITPGRQNLTVRVRHRDGSVGVVRGKLDRAIDLAGDVAQVIEIVDAVAWVEPAPSAPK